MAFIEGTDRFQSQLFDFFTFDNLISEDNYVRVIDAFVDSLNLNDLGFIIYPSERGQKPYHTDTLLKIHIYCFFNGIQSSRKQEKECSRNIELIWLTGNLKPDHSTLAAFCKNNSSALKKLDLIKQRKLEYLDLKQKMVDENISELCVTDPDSKIMKNHSNIEPCYNVQSVVDSKNKLILDYDVTNQANDVGLLKPMSDKVFEDYELDTLLEENTEHIITEIADAGYYKSDSSLYKLRKALVEHPFGTIKRSLGLTHVYIKGLDRVSSWASSVFLAYNLKRVINILGIQKLMEVFATV